MGRSQSKQGRHRGAVLSEWLTHPSCLTGGSCGAQQQHAADPCRQQAGGRPRVRTAHGRASHEELAGAEGIRNGRDIAGSTHKVSAGVQGAVAVPGPVEADQKGLQIGEHTLRSVVKLPMTVTVCCRSRQFARLNKNNFLSKQCVVRTSTSASLTSSRRDSRSTV